MWTCLVASIDVHMLLVLVDEVADSPFKNDLNSARLIMCPLLLQVHGNGFVISIIVCIYTSNVKLNIIADNKEYVC